MYWSIFFSSSSALVQRIANFLRAMMPSTICRHVLVQQRLAAGDRDDRRAAFVDRAERVFDGQALVQDRVGIVDLAAAGAGQVAAKQRLHHQHERIALAAEEVLLEDIAADRRDISQRNAQNPAPANSARPIENRAVGVKLLQCEVSVGFCPALASGRP